MNLTFLRPYLKAVAPAVVTVIAVVAQWVASGHLDTVAFRLALAGLITTGAVYWVPNTPPKPAAAVPPAPTTPVKAPPA